MSSRSRRAEALAVAEEILTDIELHRMGGLDIARKTSRLARLLDDEQALRWLSYETGGYPPDALDQEASSAARASRRLAKSENGQDSYWTESLGTLEQRVVTGAAELTALANSPAPSGEWAPTVENSRVNQRVTLRDRVDRSKRLLDSVVGAFHGYAASRYQELRFGSTVESAFEVVRSEVDRSIGSLVPDAMPMLNGAFENAVSDNPEHWANAASTCRRLLKTVADALRPPGPPVSKNGRPVKMDDGAYINRLIDWIERSTPSKTEADNVVSDLEYLGRRLDAADEAGQKGAHATVDRFEASRYITGTYLLLGDILRLTASRTAGAIESA